MYLLNGTVFVANYHLYRMDRQWNKTEFTYFVFVLSKILVENGQYTLQDQGRIIEISG